MKLEWLCEEKLTAVSLGCAGLMLADGGLISGGVIAGAGLLGMWNKARRADGVNSEKLLAEVRKQVRADFERWAAGESLSEADLRAGDKAMAEHLHECVPPVADLAKTTFHSEDFPAFAALLVVDRLAQHNPIFSIDHPARSPVARDFALVVVKGALTKAKEQAPFMQRLTQEVVLLLPQHLVRLEGKVDGIAQGQAEQMALLNQIVASLQPTATAQGVNAEKLIALASQIVAKVDDVDEAERALAAAIEELLKLREEARRGTNFGDEVDEAIRRIFAKVEANDFAGAQKQGDEEYRRLSEQAEQLQAARESVVETNLSVARMAYDADRMAHWALERRRLVECVEQLTVELVREEQDAWDQGAQRSGVMLDMFVAIVLARHSIAKATSPVEQIMCQNDLAISLTTQGERVGGEVGLVMFGEAVAAFRTALEDCSCAELSLQWAMTQNNLGNTLGAMGRWDGGGAGIALLSEAVAAYRLALKVYSFTDFPADWAMTLNNLGTALVWQGARLGGDEELALLCEATEAYEGALKVRTPSEMPVEWAGTMSNLGTVRLRLARWAVGDTAIELLSEAVRIFTLTQVGFPRIEMPVNWAKSCFNLGNSLLKLGERIGGAAGVERLNEAIAAYGAALEVHTLQEMPVDWGETMINLGVAEELIGDFTLGTDRQIHWRSARESYLSALEVFDSQHMPNNHDKCTQALTRVRAKLASLT